MSIDSKLYCVFCSLPSGKSHLVVALCILLDRIAMEEAAIRNQKKDIAGANDILQNFKIALTSVTNTAVSINATCFLRIQPYIYIYAYIYVYMHTSIYRYVIESSCPSSHVLRSGGYPPQGPGQARVSASSDYG